MILYILIFLYLIHFDGLIAASRWQQFHRFFNPKRIPHRFSMEDQDDEDEEITIVRRPALPFYPPQAQTFYYPVPLQQRAQQLPYYDWQSQKYPEGYQGPSPKEVEHRMYSTKIIDECQPQFPQYSYGYQQPQMQQQQMPPINLYLGGGGQRQFPTPSGSYNVNFPPPAPAVPYSQYTYRSPYYEEGQNVSNDERIRQFHHNGQQALHHMEKMFDEMGRTASHSDLKNYEERRKKILESFRSMFGEFDTQYATAINARGRREEI